jgi:hypothetical protein
MRERCEVVEEQDVVGKDGGQEHSISAAAFASQKPLLLYLTLLLPAPCTLCLE